MAAAAAPTRLNPPLAVLRQMVHQGSTASLAWRLEQLDRLERVLEAARQELPAALAADLERPEAEALFELASLRDQLRVVRRHLPRWMRPRPVPMPLWALPGRAAVVSQPLGCVLILAPWNYPFQLCLQPLVSVLAAGNTAVLKPSEHAPATSELVARLIRAEFPADTVQVLEGDAGVAEALLQQRFDHILFTGSGPIGRRVMAAAARHLTPVTLELGGSCPVIVLDDADIAVTARRLAWGKSVNAGQSCVAPNHVFVVESRRQELVEALAGSLRSFHGPDPLSSADLGRIVNRRQFNRLEGWLQAARQRGSIRHGGGSDADRKRIEPTVIEAAGPEDPLLQEEIFGPLLPILGVPDLEAALELIRRQPAAMAVYLFGGTACDHERVLRSTRSGSLVRNDVMVQGGIAELPFGGVGESGIGGYHGLVGFQTFSANRSLLARPFRLDLPLRYPPYTTWLPWLRRLLG